MGHDSFMTAFFANFLLSVPVKIFENWSICGKDLNKRLVSCFLTHGVVTICINNIN